MRHPIQCRRLEKQFRGLLRKGAGVHLRAEDSLTAKEGGLDQTAPMIPRLLFPAPPPLAPDGPQVLIPLPGRARALAMLPDLGIPARGHDSLGAALDQRIVAGALVIGPVGTDLTDGLL